MNDESRLPDFLAVGPQRTGTTWLHEVMKPHLGLPRGIKETDFFLKNYSQGIAWYREYFRDYPPELTLGEVDPNYFGEDVARDRIEKDLPRAKIVVTLRDPVERAYSSYRVMRRDAWTRVSFEETVAKNRIIRESSRYAHHLGNWQRSFGKDRVLVCFYDDLEQSPQKFLDQICDFIGAKRIKVEGSRLSLGARQHRHPRAAQPQACAKCTQRARLDAPASMASRWNSSIAPESGDSVSAAARNLGRSIRKSRCGCGSAFGPRLTPSSASWVEICPPGRSRKPTRPHAPRC